MTATPAGALDALIEQARAAIAGASAPPGDEPFVGEAADGMIAAEVTAEGRVAAIRVDATMARRPIADVAADIAAAVNAALDARPERVSTAPILAELQAVQEQSVAQMSAISAAFTEALAKAQRT